LLSRAFWWESLLRWDLGFHGAFGYQGASFSKHFILFFSLGYHRALLRIFLSHGGIQAKMEPFFTNFSFSQWNSGYNGAFFTNFSFSQWNSGCNGALSLNHSFTLGFRLSQSLFMESFFYFGISLSRSLLMESFFTLGLRLSRSLLMESFFYFRLSAIMESSHGIILSLLYLINMDSHKHISRVLL
jgi:hypothetical protein